MIGTIFLQIGGKFPKMVPLLLPNFGSSLKWYLLASKSQKGAKFLGGLTPLNPLGGYKKSVIGGLILRGV